MSDFLERVLEQWQTHICWPLTFHCSKFLTFQVLTVVGLHKRSMCNYWSTSCLRAHNWWWSTLEAPKKTSINVTIGETIFNWCERPNGHDSPKVKWLYHMFSKPSNEMSVLTFKTSLKGPHLLLTSLNTKETSSLKFILKQLIWATLCLCKWSVYCKHLMLSWVHTWALYPPEELQYSPQWDQTDFFHWAFLTISIISAASWTVTIFSAPSSSKVIENCSSSAIMISTCMSKETKKTMQQNHTPQNV